MPTCSVSLDRVVRSVSASEQSDESGSNPSIRRLPSPSIPRPDSRPGIGHQPSNPANHCSSALGPHRGSRGTYGVVPRPEGPGEDGVLPGKQGVSGGRSPPLVHEQSAPSQPQPRTLCSVGGRTTCAGRRPLAEGGPFTKGPPPPASRAPPPEGGGYRCSHSPRTDVLHWAEDCDNDDVLPTLTAHERSYGYVLVLAEKCRRFLDVDKRRGRGDPQGLRGGGETPPAAHRPPDAALLQEGPPRTGRR